MSHQKQNLLTSVEVAPLVAPANACVIWLHGLGAKGEDFIEALPYLNLPSQHRIRFVFPQAPLQAVTLNGGMRMPAWYDIYGLNIDALQDEEGLKKASHRIGDLMTSIIAAGIPSHRIILIGFSQGGALALHTALRFEHTLAGVAGLSTYLPLHTKLPREKSVANAQIPIFLAHGLMDVVVTYELGRRSLICLEEAGYTPRWYAYPMAHTLCLPQLNELGQWISRMLS